MNQISFESDNTDDLVIEFHSKMTALQSEIMAAITQAQSNGDIDRVVQLNSELGEQISALTESYAKKVEDLIGQPSEESGPYQFDCDLDLDLTVYDGDRDSYIEFGNDPNIQHAAKELHKHTGKYNSRRQLLKSSLKLTPAMAPHIYEIGNRCKEIIGTQSTIEFYVYQDDRFNASVYPPDADKIYIMLSSGIIERFKNDELCFVIGHELGHTLFNHHEYPARGIMDAGDGYLSPIHAMKLFSWGRAAEISADRVGLICCQDFTAAARAFFKLSSGVTSDSLDFRLDEYIAQFVDLSAEMATENIDPSDWYSTHPFSPLRIKALEIFHRSKTYHTLTNNNPSYSVSEEEMEVEIAQFMSLMEPAHMNKNSEVGGDVQQFIFLSGYLIAKSDGSIDDSETHALSQLVSAEVFSQCMKQVTSDDVDDDDIKGAIAGKSDTLNQFLSPIQKLNIIRDLCLIASADGELDDNEVEVLHQLCYLLKIQPDFADQVLHDGQAELD